MRLYIVRHGESTDNVNKIHQGHRNSPLTNEGILQAKAVAQRLKNEEFDVAYASDLDRTIKTAEEILKFHPKLNLIKLKELREQSKGIYEGKPYGAIDKELKKRNLQFHEFKPEGGESIQDTWNNMVSFYNNIKINHKDDSVLVVGHGGPILCLIIYLHKDKIENFKKYTPINNTSVTIVDIDKNGNHELSRLNCTNHLR